MFQISISTLCIKHVFDPLWSLQSARQEVKMVSKGRSLSGMWEERSFQGLIFLLEGKFEVQNLCRYLKKITDT